MDFHGINTVGKNWLERINSKPVFQNQWIGRIIFALDTQTLSIGTSAGWIDIASAQAGGLTNPSIPIGSVILFDADVAQQGYILLTDVDDRTVMITKGSVAGGETGGQSHSTGDWDLSHTHAVSALSVPDHNHMWNNYIVGGTDKSWDSDGITQLQYDKTGTGNLGICTQADGDKFNGKDFWTQNTSLSISGSTDNAALTSWRPKARNFTRQQKI